MAATNMSIYIITASLLESQSRSHMHTRVHVTSPFTCTYDLAPIPMYHAKNDDAFAPDLRGAFFSLKKRVPWPRRRLRVTHGGLISACTRFLKALQHRMCKYSLTLHTVKESKKPLKIVSLLFSISNCSFWCCILEFCIWAGTFLLTLISR
jgi:hypothetical protein